MENPDTHVKSAPKRKKIALLVTHGMGEQERFDVTDSFVRGIAGQMNGDPPRAPLVRLDHAFAKPGKSDLDVRSYVQIHIPRMRDPDISRVDVHEVFWADKPKGLMKLGSVARWAWDVSLTPLLSWSQQASIMAEAARSRWTALLLMLREILRALLLPVIGIAILGLAFWVPPKIANYINVLQERFDTVSATDYLDLGLFLVPALLALMLLVGSLRIRNTVKAERGFRYEATPPGAQISDATTTGMKARERKLRLWAIASVVMALGLGGLSWFTYGSGDVPELVRRILNLDSDTSALRLLAVVGLGGGALFVAGKAGGFLVDSVGDVAIYVQGSDEKSKFHQTRLDILSAMKERIIELTGDTALDQKRPYDGVYIAAHSLGSVVAYDAISELMTLQRARRATLSKESLEKFDRRFDRMRGLLSFGAPHDKIYYFFRRKVDSGQRIKAQLLSSTTSFKKAASYRPYGSLRFKRYETATPEGFKWWSAWSKGDPLGHHLDRYDPDFQKRFRYPPIMAHFRFWDDPEFHRMVLDWLHGIDPEAEAVSPTAAASAGSDSSG